MSITSRNARAKEASYPLISSRQKATIIKRVKGMWRNRKPDPIKELNKMRREWDNK